MTKLEFIQEAALRLITAKPQKLMGEIADMARILADEIFMENGSISKERTTNLLAIQVAAGNDISDLVKEIDKIDVESTKELNNKYKEKYEWVHSYFQKGGLAVRAEKIFSEENIKTVGELLDIGRDMFSRKKNIGIKTVEIIDKALFNLYGITNW